MKTEAEINAEKNAKSRVDIVPPALVIAAGRALGFGAAKHGVPEGYDGFGTWRVAGTQQADPLTHYACLMRHLLKWREGEIIDPETGDAQIEHLEAACAQMAILIDLVKRPPGGQGEPPEPEVEQWLPAGWEWNKDSDETWLAQNGDVQVVYDPQGPGGCNVFVRRNGHPPCGVMNTRSIGDLVLQRNEVTT